MKNAGGGYRAESDRRQGQEGVHGKVFHHALLLPEVPAGDAQVRDAGFRLFTLTDKYARGFQTRPARGWRHCRSLRAALQRDGPSSITSSSRRLCPSRERVAIRGAPAQLASSPGGADQALPAPTFSARPSEPARSSARPDRKIADPIIARTTPATGLAAGLAARFAPNSPGR